MFGRHGEAPVPIVAAKTPSHCFEAAIEAVRIALRYRTPVYLLSDGYLANGSEPWKLPDVESLPDISVDFATETNATDAAGEPTFWPYLRDPESLARPWAIPGTPGLEHRIGGLEKQDGIGTVSYESANHEAMVHVRAAKIAGIAKDLEPVEADDPTGEARVLLLGWGSTYAAITAGVKRVRKLGKPVAQVHLVHLNPFPPNLGPVLQSYDSVLVPEGNLGHLTRLVRSDFLVDAKVLSRVQGSPFRVGDIERAILQDIERLEAGGAPSGATRMQPSHGESDSGGRVEGVETVERKVAR
jgi:2-oxoglutarate ferredoxin oxidoreductase subunit alpha